MASKRLTPGQMAQRTGTEINALDGTDQLKRGPIYSGGDALDFLDGRIDGNPHQGMKNPDCNCEERRKRYTETEKPIRLPRVTEEGICVSCGCVR